MRIEEVHCAYEPLFDSRAQRPPRRQMKSQRPQEVRTRRAASLKSSAKRFPQRTKIDTQIKDDRLAEILKIQLNPDELYIYISLKRTT